MTASDDVGEELASLEAARRYASLALTGILQDRMLEDRAPLTMAMLVRDSSGVVLKVTAHVRFEFMGSIPLAS